MAGELGREVGGVAEQPGALEVGGCVEDVGRGTELPDAAPKQQGRAVRERGGFVAVVGDEQDGRRR